MLCMAMFCILSAATVDGDTFTARAPWGRQYFRLWGVSAPELSEAEGPASKAALSSLINGQSLSCDVAGVPSFNRLVVQCSLPDGRDLGCEMIRQGHAIEWLSFSGGAYARCDD